MRVGATVGTHDDNDYLGWLLGGVAGLSVLVVLLPIILVSAIFPATGGGGSAVEQIGPGTPIPVAFVPIFNQAGTVLDVNPYLLASVADQESSFGTGAGWSTVNYAGCVGFMQTCVGGAGGDSWDSTVTLTAHPRMTLAERFAYRLGTRPASYPLQTQSHPSYNDPFDAVMAAAVEIRGKVGGRPIPSLDETAYQAACGYYGACADNVANYAQTVINRARLWESESALNPPSFGAAPIAVTPGSRLGQVISVADQITAMRIPYCYGGGHASVPGPSVGTYCHTVDNSFDFGDPEPGLDCSGAVRWLLVSVGYLDPGGIDSGEMGGWLAPGPGRYVSVYYNAGHTFMSIAGRFWGTSDSNYRGGPGWVAQESMAGYAVAHPAGL